jgi:hypothetical protein
MMKFLSFLLVAAFASTTFAESSGKPCPGGYSHGTQMDIGRYWYECRDGKVIPKGCLAENGNRVDVDSTFDTAQYRMQCVLSGDGFLSVVYKACMSQGGSHDVGSQWDDGVAFFTCVKEGDNVRVITLGCVDQGRPMKLDERVAKGDFIFQCKKATDGTPKMNKVGCVFDGRKFNIGEQYEGPKFWYTCTDSGSKIVGCMYESHRLQDGDHFTKDDMMYSCKVNGDQTDFIPFACIQKEESGAAIERRVGCSWVEGRGSEAYEYTCKDNGSNKVSKIQMQCVYRAPQGVFKLQPGCVQLADSIAVGCLQDSSSGNLRIETYSAEKIDRLPGLRRC